MVVKGFICCPRCGTKTKTKIDDKTVMKHFPLWCSWCREETLIDVAGFAVTRIDKGDQID